MSDPTATPEIPDEAVTFASGGRMPLLGFGTWQIKGRDAVEATSAALDVGYRHLDTATIYGNESEVGQALAESPVARQEVFVTTKCPPDLADQALDTLRRSLDQLGTDHVDLWLIHWPGDGATNLALWRAFVEARESGLAKDIGVSNFSVEQIDEIAAATGATPAVNQIKWSPRHYDPAVLEEHRARGVTVEGYSGLRGGVLDHPTVVGIAERLGRTPAQVVLRWHLQHEVVAIPKSTHADRIRSNADLAGFSLSPDDMAALNHLRS